MTDDNEQIEIDLLLQAVYIKYGYDFRNYARASIKRRILKEMSVNGLKSISEMQHRLLYDAVFFNKVLPGFSINVTEMFRDPFFYLALRKHVIPYLKTLPYLKVWHAGCASGEEVYSLAITLLEERLTKKILIYATDFNVDILEKAKEGIYKADNMELYNQNYLKSGGNAALSDYYTKSHGYITIKSTLRENIMFADHNLSTDSSFGEMNLILCRNVLIYFNRELQNRVIGLFDESLIDSGFLCLGSKETIRFSDYQERFREVDTNAKIYQKK